MLPVWSIAMRDSLVSMNFDVATAEPTTHIDVDQFAFVDLIPLVNAEPVPEVLFVCVHNAGRSQMAAALLDHMAAGRVHVRSAGSDPADRINPDVVTAMSELGLDLSKEFPKPMTDEAVRAADAVITMGCGDACPIYPGKRYEDWEVDDPAEADLDGVRRIRDDIADRVRVLLAQLAPASQGSPDQPDGGPSRHSGYGA
jgi:arsenate reductase (thioredoxin)